jgi:serine/threonine protein kinase
MMKQIIGAVESLHNKHQVTHRDLKPENFLLKRKDDISELRMIDFGLSRFYTPDERLRTRVGTVYYTAPEVWNENYDQSCDLWSAGVIMYVLLCSYPPFDGDTDKEILRAVCRGKYSFPSPEWDDVSAEAKSLIRKLLSKNPRRRPTATESLKDEWFKIAGEEEGDEDDGEYDLDDEDDPNNRSITTNTATVQLTDSNLGDYDEGDLDLDEASNLKGIKRPSFKSPPQPPSNDSAAGYAQMIRTLNEEKKKQNLSSSYDTPPSPTSINEATQKKRGKRRQRETSENSIASVHVAKTPETSPEKNNDDDDWGITSSVTSVGSAMGFY